MNRRGFELIEAMIILAIAGIVFCLGMGVHYRLTHHCVKSHIEQHMSCTSYYPGRSGGLGFSDCKPYTADVCDEWEKNR